MMLSGTGFAPVQPTLDLTQFSLIPIPFVLTGESISPVDQPTEGGFVKAYFTSGVPLAFAADSVSTDAVLSFDGRGVSVTENGHFNNFTPGNVFDRADNYGDSQASPVLVGSPSTSLIDSGGLVGQHIDVIPAWPTSNDSPVINMQPVVVGPSPSTPSTPAVSEGGSIPIHAIFADFHKDSFLASGVKAISSPAGERSVEALASARRVPMAETAITGEWARAMVFEIAGGEPTASDSQSPGAEAGTTSSNATLQQSKPLSSVDTSQQAEKLASRHESAAANDETSAGESGQLQEAQANGQIATVVAKLLSGGQLSADPSAAAGGEFGNQAFVGESPDITALAAGTVFDQLGEGNAAVIESTVDGKSWLRSIGTSPLLMVLALERIAALNSRRASRETRVAGAKKPLRLRS